MIFTLPSLEPSTIRILQSTHISLRYPAIVENDRIVKKLYLKTAIVWR